MSARSRRQKQESESPIETLRIERTNLTQDELAIGCGIPRATYQRWISGKTEARLSLSQMKRLCKVLGIERIDELPDDFASSARSAPSAAAKLSPDSTED